MFATPPHPGLIRDLSLYPASAETFPFTLVSLVFGPLSNYTPFRILRRPLFPAPGRQIKVADDTASPLLFSLSSLVHNNKVGWSARSYQDPIPLVTFSLVFYFSSIHFPTAPIVEVPPLPRTYEEL